MKLDGFYAKAVNADFEKYTFSLAGQARNEPFDAFVNRLRVLSTNCGFNDHPWMLLRTVESESLRRGVGCGSVNSNW